MRVIVGKLPFEPRRRIRSVQTKMFNTQNPYHNELLRKTTFYGQPIPDPCFSSQSSASRSSASLNQSISFSFGGVGLLSEVSPEGRGSLSRTSQPLVMPPPEQEEMGFPVPRTGRLSATRGGKGSSQKKGVGAGPG